MGRIKRVKADQVLSWVRMRSGGNLGEEGGGGGWGEFIARPIMTVWRSFISSSCQSIAAPVVGKMRWPTPKEESGMRTIAPDDEGESQQLLKCDPRLVGGASRRGLASHLSVRSLLHCHKQPSI